MKFYQKIQYLCNICFMISKHHIVGEKYMHNSNKKKEKYYYMVHPMT